MATEIKNVYDLLRMAKPKPITPDSGDLPFKAPINKPESLPVGRIAQVVEEGEFCAKPKKTEAQPKAQSQSQPARTGLLQKDIIKYPLIFVVAFGFFYFFLNFGAFSDKIGAWLFTSPPAQPQNIEGRVLGASTPEYNAWIAKYFYQVNTADAINPNVDYDRDGLSNYQEFLLGANPTNPDTDGDSYGDSREVLNGYNPLGEGKLTAEQNGIIKDWDLQEISNRVAYNALSNLPLGPDKPSLLPTLDYSLAANGELVIPKLNIHAPLIWSNSDKNFTADLEKGLIHYPGTAYPGQEGVAYVSGHSSNYVWSKSPYSHIFSRIDEMRVGDEFFISMPKAGGGSVSLRYVVVSKNEYKPEDQSQFESALSGSESIVNLSTCWPLGSTAKRMVVSGKMTGV